MRKLLVIFLVLALLAPLLFAKSKIFFSPLGGYSLLRGDYIISYFDDEGNLDRGKLECMAEYIGRYADNTREFSFWIDSKNSLEKLRPFKKVGNTIQVTAEFERNWREIVTVFNSRGVRVWVSLWDHCGWRKNSWNPWTAAFGEDSFYSEKARDARHKWIDAFLRIGKDRILKFELINEPRVPHCTPEFLGDTFCYLVRKGVQPGDIMLGIEYPLKEKDPRYSELYRKFRKYVVKELGPQWAQWFKDRCISPCHGMSMENLKEMLGPNPRRGWTRNVIISMDGVRQPRPNKHQVKEVFAYALEKKSKAAWQGKISLEVIFGKTSKDPLDSIEGAMEAYREFYGEYPKNYRGYLDGLKKPSQPNFCLLFIWR